MTRRPQASPQIQAPELQPAPERTRDTFFTAIMWGIYLYLWAPLISLFAWWLGFEFAYDVMVRSGGGRGLGNVLTFYAIAVTVILVVVAAWSVGNRLRYGKLSRRRSASETTLDAMAAYFRVDPATARRLRGLKLAQIEFDADGRPVIVDHDPERPGPAPESPQWRGSEAANAAARARQSHP